MHHTLPTFAIALLTAASALAGSTVDRSLDAVARDAVAPRHTWDLTPVYSVDAWEADFARVERALPRLEAFEGTLDRSAAHLLEYLRLADEVGARLDRLRLYAKLSSDLATEDPECTARADRVGALGDRVASARAFLRPEIVALGPENVERFLAEDDGLRLYRQALEEILDGAAHTQSAPVERLLAQAGRVLDIPRATHRAMVQDFDRGTVLDESGRPISLSGGVHLASQTSLDRDFRARVHRAFFRPYVEHASTAAALVAGRLQTRIFEASVRGYSSAMEASLAPHHIPTSVYRDQIVAARSNVGPLQRWIALKKRLLGVEKLHDYDTHVTLFPADKQEYTYEQAQEILTAALAPLGPAYVADLRRVFDERWIDVYPTVGKASGAYSSGATYGVHPYVLVNWHGQVTELFELAHEIGHCLHAHSTVQAQPYVYAGYSTFAGEVAAVTNEVLLARYLTDRAATPRERAVQIEQQLNNIKMLYYWTTLLAELEMDLYDRTAAGEPASPESYCAILEGLYGDYFGPQLTVLPEDTFTWAALRHLFIADFYLYQYATSYAAAEQIVSEILDDPGAAPRYLEFLRSGRSRHPLDALRLAGVDMTSPEPSRAVARRMEQLLDELETIIASG